MIWSYCLTDVVHICFIGCDWLLEDDFVQTGLGNYCRLQAVVGYFFDCVDLIGNGMQRGIAGLFFQRFSFKRNEADV